MCLIIWKYLIFDTRSFANANVLLVLGEIMGGNDAEDGAPSRSAIPLIGGAIVLAQFTMVREAVAFFQGFIAISRFPSSSNL